MTDSIKSTKINRRQYLKGTAMLTGLASSTGLLSACSLNFEFLHGVASGDALSDRVIIWTRVTPKHQLVSQVEVSWEVATDKAFGSVISSGAVMTNLAKDFTVKVDATGLQAGTVYYYRFKADGCVSPVGQTRTLPVGHVEKVKLAAVSCANYPQGYFNIYGEIARRDDIDFVVHLGDYLYEYGPGTYDDEDEVAQQRIVDPPREILSLEDYRKRYAQYRRDANLKALHARHPFFCIWDDHEVANDAYKDGAENHNENEGDYEQRRSYALQVYYEWMPIRDNTDPINAYRHFSFGDLFSLYMLETRHIARDIQLAHSDYIDNIVIAYDFESAEAAIRNPQRKLIGDTQRQWLQTTMAASTTKWQVLGQQVLMARMEVPWRIASVFEAGQELFSGTELEDLFDLSQINIKDPSHVAPRKVGYNLDAWDGYYAEREALFNSFENLDVNVINLAGDTHNAWASNLSNEQGTSIGVEFATASVSSPGISDFIGNLPFLNELFVGLVDDLHFSNVYDRGFLTVELTHDYAQAQWEFINTVKSPFYLLNPFASKTLRVLPGATNRKIVEV